MKDCPSLYELTTTPLDDEPRLRAHVEECVRCSALLDAWTRDAGAEGGETEADRWEISRLEELRQAPSVGESAAVVASGAVHSVSAPDCDHFLTALIATVDEEMATVLPVSTDMWAASDQDVLLEADVLGYPATVQLWNGIDILYEQVADRLADATATLLLVAQTKHGAAAAPAAVETGPPIGTQEDPRLEFREAEREWVRTYHEPWRRVHSANVLAGVVRQRRLEVGEELEATANDLDLDLATLQQLEHDSLDLYQGLPVPALHRLVEHFELSPGRRLYALVEDAAFRNDRSSAYGPELAVARRRRSTRSRAQPQPEDVRREHARQYVQRLRERLDS